MITSKAPMPNPKRILFLYCGGTIGQVPTVHGNEVVLSAPKDDKEFREVCEPIIKNLNADQNIEVTFELVTTKDSTNMTPNDWEKIIFRVKKAQDEEGYDAVGIAHGTDTLAYTSTALAFALHGKDPGKTGLKIPVCITGSQNPVYEQGGDGRFNLENLFRTLAASIDLEVADVLVNFWNRVLLACRCMKVNEKAFDAFHSPSYSDVGVIDSNGVHLNVELIRQKKDANLDKIALAPKFGRGVLSIELAPGVEPGTVLSFVTSGGVSCLVFKSLGEGNVCSEGEYSLLPAIKQITKDYATPVLITTKFVGGGAGAAHYETGLKAIEAGGVPCYDQTDVAVDVKARWLIGNAICSEVDGFRKHMATSYSGEVTEPKQ